MPLLHHDARGRRPDQGPLRPGTGPRRRRAPGGRSGVRIVVTIKQVPDPDVPAGSFQVDPGGRRALAPPGVAPIMNGYDANALEAALRLKEAHGGTVTALGLGAGAQGARDT